MAKAKKDDIFSVSSVAMRLQNGWDSVRAAGSGIHL